MVAPRSSSIFRISKWFLKEDHSSTFCYSGCDMKCQELLNEPRVAKHQTFYTEKTPKSALTPMKRAFLHGYLREICDILQRWITCGRLRWGGWCPLWSWPWSRPCSPRSKAATFTLIKGGNNVANMLSQEWSCNMRSHQKGWGVTRSFGALWSSSSVWLSGFVQCTMCIQHSANANMFDS